RGPIQLTGRANYRTYGRLLGVDLLAHPPLAGTPEVGFRIAGLYWKRNGLNALADQGEFRRITRRINGGYNGLQDRLRYYERAKLALSKGDPEAAVSPPRLVVDGKEAPEARPYVLRDGGLAVALRPVAAAAGWRILDAGRGQALLQDRRRESHRLALLLREGTGYVALRDLPWKEAAWDAATRVASVVSA
ncbi:MAG TPA: hypothetical protein VK689_14620, partial [Armatimonadota bacterium]|nr:hypothetical protein [Armatimonadota bacterium]